MLRLFGSKFVDQAPYNIQNKYDNINLKSGSNQVYCRIESQMITTKKKFTKCEKI